MSRAKWYAVRVGREVGVFETWEECKALVSGYKYAEYQGFDSEEEAREWLEDAYTDDEERPHKRKKLTKEQKLEGYIALAENISNEMPPGKMIAYIDGSYDAERRYYSCGCIMIKNGDVTTYTNWGHRPEAIRERNVAGELMGAMYVVKQAALQGIRDITIYHDYYGISKWYEGEWKASHFCSKHYLYFMEKFRGKMNITFEKVEGHSGNPLNEYADFLARSALEKA